jgi:hypothetical protein
MYTHEPTKATVFHPANHATILGPKSRAGLNPACVNGARTAINPPTVSPIMGGTNVPDIPLFLEFVKAKMTKDSIPVPTVSASNATTVETGALFGIVIRNHGNQVGMRG